LAGDLARAERKILVILYIVEIRGRNPRSFINIIY